MEKSEQYPHKETQKKFTETRFQNQNNRHQNVAFYLNRNEGTVDILIVASYTYSRYLE